MIFLRVSCINQLVHLWCYLGTAGKNKGIKKYYLQKQNFEVVQLKVYEICDKNKTFFYKTGKSSRSFSHTAYYL